MRFPRVFIISAILCAYLAFVPEAVSATGNTQAKHAAQQAAMQPGHIAFVGKPLLSAISELNIGQGLDKVSTIADQVGYTLVLRKDYKPACPTDALYSWYLMNGGKRVSTLFFDCRLKLCEVR